MSSHSPGPWAVDRGNVLLGTQDGDEISDSVGNRVCEVSPLSRKLANAQLIAGAPDMYQVVQRLATCDWMSEKELAMWIRKSREIIERINK